MSLPMGWIVILGAFVLILIGAAIATEITR